MTNQMNGLLQGPLVIGDRKGMECEEAGIFHNGPGQASLP